jgi:ABC-type nitrate/sulfonate/bicarbonate transport system substrate-binding protein
MRVTMRWTIAAGLAAGLLLAGAAWTAWRTSNPTRPAGPDFTMTIAVPTQLASGAVFVADQQQLFAQQGLVVKQKRFELGKQALQTVLEGGADIAIVADTPFILAVLKGEPIATMATVYESRKTIAILGHRDSGLRDPRSLEGKRVGAPFGTNAEFFLDTMLDVHGVERATVEFVNMPPDRLVAAFRARQIDAMTVWNPELTRLEQELGPKVVTMYGEDLFVYRFLLVAKRAYIDAHGAQVQQLLTALRHSNDYIKNNPEPARTLLGAEVGMAPHLLQHAFDPTDFTLVLDQSLLLALSSQMRWAMAKGLVQPGPMPNYLQFVRPAPLSAVAPDANRMIH